MAPLERHSTALKVLVVQSDPAAKLTLERWLHAAGATEVITADNGLEGLEAVLGSHPDLTVIDLDAPVIDGLQLLELIRTNPTCNRTPAVLLASNARRRDLAAAVSLGVWDYVPKPLDGQVARPRLERALRAVREKRFVADPSGFRGSQVLIIDPDPDFRRFAQRSLQPPLLVETAGAIVHGAASALTRRPGLVLAHECFYEALKRSFERAELENRSAPRLLCLVSDASRLGETTLLRTYNRPVLAAQVSRAVVESLRRSLAKLPSEPALETAAREALTSFLAMMTGDAPRTVSAATFEVSRSAWIDLHGEDGPRLRFTLEAEEGFAESLVRGLLPDSGAASANDHDSALTEAANLVGARLKDTAFEERLPLRIGPPALGDGRVRSQPHVRLSWETVYEWRGRRFRTRGEILDPERPLSHVESSPVQ